MSSTHLPAPSRVDFSYAFATPHRLTVALPDSAQKTLLDLEPGMLRIAWTTDDLMRLPVAAFVTPPTQWHVNVKPALDGQPFAASEWTRAEGWLPVLVNSYREGACTIRLEVVGGETAAITRIDLVNDDATEHTFRVSCEMGDFGGQTPAWWGQEDADVLLAGWRDRADRVLLLGLGGDAYPLVQMNHLVPAWTLAAGERKSAWLIRPYQAYEADLPALRARDWAAEFDAGKAAWRWLIEQAAALQIPDMGVQNGFYACLADLFIMREPVAGGHLLVTPGTEMYRAPNAIEAGIAAIAMEQVGLHEDAAKGYQAELELQGADGNWSDPQGWCHHFWSTPGFKSWVIMEHYRHTGDRAYLAALYPRMVASSCWQERQRTKTRVAGSVNYGLLPRGMGDAGLWDDSDMYGVFLPHNIWAVFADKCTLEAAVILERKHDLPELAAIYEAARKDLLAALDGGAIQEEGYRWIPGVYGKTSGSRWGALNVSFPCELLPRNHELVTGTIRKLESRLSPGGLPIHLGWQPDGLWVAITLDNLAEVLLQRDEGDKAADYLYATLNHATPLYTWCEERGQQPGASDCAGDRQHLWTPVSVVREVRDALMMEDGDTLHLARGAAREWLAGGLPVGMTNGSTHFGPVSYTVQYSAETRRVSGYVRMADTATAAHVVLHVRLPTGMKIVSATGATVEGETLVWEGLRGEAAFAAVVG